MSELKIVRASNSHLKSLQLISKKTFEEAYSQQNSQSDLQKYIEEKFSQQKLLNELQNPDSEFYLFYIKKKLVAYLKINFQNAQVELKEPEGMEIERIYVQREYQGSGNGQAILNKAIERAKSKKCLYVWLGVWERNPKAINFYEKNNFSAFDRHDFLLGEENQTDIMMKKELN